MRYSCQLALPSRGMHWLCFAAWHPRFLKKENKLGSESRVPSLAAIDLHNPSRASQQVTKTVIKQFVLLPICLVGDFPNSATHKFPAWLERAQREKVSQRERMGNLATPGKMNSSVTRRCHLGVAEFTGSHLGHLLNSPVEIGQVVLGEGRSILKAWFSVGC